MPTATALETIDVASLRVGMFVHLDLGWMSHPFPLSSFRISSDEQIATIRSLGLKQVRWSPSRATRPPLPDAAGAARRPTLPRRRERRRQRRRTRPAETPRGARERASCRPQPGRAARLAAAVRTPVRRGRRASCKRAHRPGHAASPRRRAQPGRARWRRRWSTRCSASRTCASAC